MQKYFYCKTAISKNDCVIKIALSVRKKILLTVFQNGTSSAIILSYTKSLLPFGTQWKLYLFGLYSGIRLLKCNMILKSGLI